MSKISKSMFKNLLLVVITMIICIVNINQALAEQIKLTLKDLGANDNVELKTVKTYRNYFFTKPKYWKALPTTKIILTFQHSQQLLPERSSLNVLINDESIKTIELNKGNSTKNTVTIAIPPSILKDYNKITLDVDQHYTYKCEDPFDPALWTTVLNESLIQLDYTKMTPECDFALFPYPFFDVLDYKITTLNFVLPNLKDKSDDTLRAMAMIDARIAQHVGWKPLNVMVFSPDKINNNENIIIVGTPGENKAIEDYQNGLPYKVSGGKLKDSSGQALDDDTGVLMVAPNPKNKTSVMLIVTGNTPAAVLKAATVLTQKPISDILKGNAVSVKQDIPNSYAEFRDWPEYITKKDARLIDIKLDSWTTRGVTSVPIVYTIKIMPDMSLPPKSFVMMKVVYSYAAHLDADQSQLEVILNDKSLHSANLSNPDGENLKVLELKIPTENFKTYNELKFRFHLFPIKYDLCRFTTDEHIWGTLHNTTGLSFPSDNRTVIPDMGLINDGGYPFTAYPDLQDDIFVLADNFNAYDVYGMLWVTARLAKMTSPTQAVNVDVVRESNLKGDQKSSKNIIAIGTMSRNNFIKNLNAELHLIYEDKFKLFKKKSEEVAKLKDIPNQGIVEQMLSPWNSNRVVMVLYGKDNDGLVNAISLFGNDNKFKLIDRGNLVAVTGNTVKSILTLSQDQVKQIVGDQIKHSGFGKNFWVDILKIALMVIGALALIRLFFGMFFGARSR